MVIVDNADVVKNNENLSQKVESEDGHNVNDFRILIIVDHHAQVGHVVDGQEKEKKETQNIASKAQMQEERKQR